MVPTVVYLCWTSWSKPHLRDFRGRSLKPVGRGFKICTGMWVLYTRLADPRIPHLPFYFWNLYPDPKHFWNLYDIFIYNVFNWRKGRRANAYGLGRAKNGLKKNKHPPLTIWWKSELFHQGLKAHYFVLWEPPSLLKTGLIIQHVNRRNFLARCARIYIRHPSSLLLFHKHPLTLILASFLAPQDNKYANTPSYLNVVICISFINKERKQMIFINDLQTSFYILIRHHRCTYLKSIKC